MGTQTLRSLELVRDVGISLVSSFEESAVNFTMMLDADVPFFILKCLITIKSLL